MALRYDGLAQDLLKVALLALSVTAAVGSLMLTMFIMLYPSFMQYMGGTFKGMMPLYALVFVGTHLPDHRLLLQLGTNGGAWNEMGSIFRSACSRWCGDVITAAGEFLVCVYDGALCVDGQGRYLGKPWHLLPLCPLESAQSSSVSSRTSCRVARGAGLRLLPVFPEEPEERAYYDWVGYVSICHGLRVAAMPPAGYWLMRSVLRLQPEHGRHHDGAGY